MQRHALKEEDAYPAAEDGYGWEKLSAKHVRHFREDYGIWTAWPLPHVMAVRTYDGGGEGPARTVGRSLPPSSAESMR